MLWIRGLLFTVLVPWMVGVAVTQWISGENRAAAWPAQAAGWFLAAVGAMFYAVSLLRFLQAGGTPAIYFTRPLRWVLGDEPPALVERGFYRFTRNPMYVGVITAVLAQSLLYQSWGVALYGVLLWPWFHFVVTVLEEPHLREKMGASYDAYCQRVPRWLWKVKGRGPAVLI